MRLSTRFLASVAVLSVWIHPVAATEILPADRIAVRADRVNVRVAPSRDAEVLATLRRGDVVDVRGAEAGGWTRIAVPSQVPVWVYGPLVDVPGRKVKAKEANLRSGPGKNYSELGRLKQGDPLIVVREADGWVQVEPPGSVSAYISSGFLNASKESGLVLEPLKSEGVLPPEPTVVRTEKKTVLSKESGGEATIEFKEAVPPAKSESDSVVRRVVAPEAAKTEEILPAIPLTPATPPVSTPPASSPLQSSFPAVSVVEGAQPLIRYNDSVRTVVRVGKVSLSLEPQSPSYFHLESVRKGEGSLGFLSTEDQSIRFATFRGKVVRVVAKEFQTPDRPSKTILQVETIGLEPGY